MRNTAKIETVYTYSEWCKLVDRHGKEMAKRYLKRKIKKLMIKNLCKDTNKMTIVD